MVFSLLLALLLQAALVHTIEGRLEGEVRLEETGVIVDGKLIPWKRVVYILLDRFRPLLSPNRVLLTTGEILVGRVLSFSNGSLRVRLGPWGEVEVREEMIAAIDFSPNLPSSLNAREPMLYIEGKEPLPGRLIEISEAEIVVDSLFGEVRTSRGEAIRYLFGRKWKQPVSNGWEVELTNGSRLFGELRITRDGEALFNHPLLGELKIPVSLISYAAKRSVDLMDLTELIASVEEINLLGFGKRKGEIELVQPYEVSGKRYLKAAIIGAGNVARFKLPEGEWVFKGLIAPMKGCEGDVKVKVRVSGETVLRLS